MMPDKEFFPRRPETIPTIYAYEDTNPQYCGLLKIGYTTRSVKERVTQQYPTLRPGPLPYRIVLEEPAMKGDGGTFTDHEVHYYLRCAGKKNPDGEWFQCTMDDVHAALVAIKRGDLQGERRSYDFVMRPEQLAAVTKSFPQWVALRGGETAFTAFAVNIAAALSW